MTLVYIHIIREEYALKKYLMYISATIISMNVFCNAEAITVNGYHLPERDVVVAWPKFQAEKIFLGDTKSGTINCHFPYKYPGIIYHYKLSLNESSTVKLHFVSHVENRVEFKFYDVNENPIKPFCYQLNINKSPYTNTVGLPAGEYDFIVYGVRHERSPYDEGYFWFRFEKE